MGTASELKTSDKRSAAAAAAEPIGHCGAWRLLAMRMEELQDSNAWLRLL